MTFIKRYSFVVAASLLLAACAGDVEENNTGTIESEPAVSESIESEASSEIGSSVESTESTESTESEAESASSEETTSLNEDESVKIENAMAKITELTGIEEGDQYMFLIDSVEGETVQINVREDGEDVANNAGLYQYDNATDTLYVQDMLTGEFEEVTAE